MILFVRLAKAEDRSYQNRVDFAGRESRAPAVWIGYLPVCSLFIDPDPNNSNTAKQSS